MPFVCGIDIGSTFTDIGLRRQPDPQQGLDAQRSFGRLHEQPRFGGLVTRG